MPIHKLIGMSQDLRDPVRVPHITAHRFGTVEDHGPTRLCLPVRIPAARSLLAVVAAARRMPAQGGVTHTARFRDGRRQLLPGLWVVR